MSSSSSPAPPRLSPPVDDPWVSKPSSSSTARSSSSGPHASHSARIRPNLASMPSTDDPASAWARDDPLSGDTRATPQKDHNEAEGSTSHPNRSTQQGISSGATSNGQLTTSDDDDSGHVKAAVEARNKSAKVSAAKSSSREEAAAAAATPQLPARTSSSSHGIDSRPAPSQPKSIDYNQLHALCTNGDLDALKTSFAQAMQVLRVSSFALANTPNPASGLTPVHYAAKEGRVDILKWLIEDMGALASMEDREGETALHKAAMFGKLPALSYLLSVSRSDVDVNVVDADGWTPMHNACSKGYLDIVKYLVDTAKASVDLQGGRGGWTPLMNAASNGHLPIVRYLTARCQVDPYTRNASGETAFDVAAAKFEVYICQVLEAYEIQKLPLLNEPSAPRQTYNPLLLHVTVPVIVHQNERLDTRVSTLAVRGGRPRWSGTNAGRPGKADRRAPGTMLSGPLSSSKTREIPMRREDVQLPTRQEPYRLRLPHRRTLSRPAAIVANRAVGETTPDDGEDLASTPTRESVLQQSRTTSAEPSHFWLSEWQIDRTHPQVDPIEGWQYAHSFDAPEEAWSAQVPPQLGRLLEGKGMGAAFTRALSGQTSNAGFGDDEAVPTHWVRRRRWIRVMRRRLDIEFGDGLEAAEIETAEVGEDRIATAQLSAARQARSDLDQLPSTASYLERATALAGHQDREQLTPADMLADPATIPGQIVRLEMAIGELRSSAFEDVDKERQVQAETLLKEYTLQLGQLRQAASSEEDAESEDDDEDGFIYPNSFKDTQSVITRMDGPPPSVADTVTALRPPSMRHQSSSSTSISGDRTAGATSAAQRRVADLARASEFRVPTNETPQSHQSFSSRPHTVLQPTSLAPTWEPDVNAPVCRLCSKRFTFFTRKHHCRRCGRIFCAECSAYRAQLSADELVIDPAQPELFLGESMGGLSRICGTCDAERQLPEALRSSAVRGMAAMGALNLGGASTASSSATSRASQLNECPVCNTALGLLGTQSAQEMHVQTCLETGGAGGAASVQAGRYLVYRLPAESPILGRECVICLEELDLGQMIARLPCLCFFHRNCIDSWLGRGRSCPTHAR